MEISRRAAVALLGTTGLGGGVAYWRRDRLRRRQALDGVEAAREIHVHDVLAPVSIDSDHLGAAYQRARSYCRETDDLVDPDEESTTAERLDRAETILEEYRPDVLESPSSRPAAVEEYHLAIDECAWVRGDHFDEDDAPPSDELEAAIDAFDARSESFDAEYSGSTLTSVIVHGAEADRLRAGADDDHETVRRFTEWSSALENRPSATGVWGSVAVGTARLQDAERFLERRGPDRSADLEAAFDRLAAWTDERLEDVRWEDEEGEPTAALRRWETADARPRPDPDDHLEEGRPALAVREEARAAMLAASLGPFETVPDSAGRTETTNRVASDSETFVEAKRAAVEEIATVAAEHDRDPLGRALLIEAVEEVERGDAHLERLGSKWWSADDPQWTGRRNRASLRYLGAEASAAAIPAVLGVVPE